MAELEPIRDQQPRHKALLGTIGRIIFRSFYGYSREDAARTAYWKDTGRLLHIDGTVTDRDWIKNRERELLNLSADVHGMTTELRVAAYARAHLEDYCRHQGVLDDGRRVVQLPVYGLDRQELSSLGIAVDSFARARIGEDTSQSYVAILPHGWSFGPEYAGDIVPGEASDPLSNERWAHVFNDSGDRVVDVFYSNKPFGFDDSFKSRTQLPWVAAGGMEIDS